MTPPASTPPPDQTDLPGRARVVIIGGGVIGCSVAYHLAHLGWTDVLLLERDRLTSGTTWHAAGLVTCFGSTSETSTGIRMYGRDLYARLEAETGVATGFRPVGLIEAAADVERLEEYRRVAAFQRHLGLEVEEVSPSEMSDLFPWARTDDLLAGFHVPGDGRVNPVDLTSSLARGAKNRGVTVREGVRVTDVVVADGPAGVGTVTGVRTSAGDIECEYVVNCTGMWARELGERNGLVIPNQAAEHYYLITDTIEGLGQDTPVFEDPSSYGYYREEGGGMMVGLFEPEAAAWSVYGIPPGFSFGTLPPDWDRMAPFLEKAMDRVPITHEVGIRTFFCGPESFTPDLQPAVGEAPGIRGYFVAAGMNSVGILSAGGLGRVLAHWITTGRPDVDVTGIDVARFRPHQLAPAYRAARTVEILGTVYAAHPPGAQLRTARGALLSPVHQRLVDQGGYLRDVSGWEGAAWFAAAGRTPEATPTWGRAPWFAQWEAEHRAVREDVGLIDMSFMAKLDVRGPGAGALLDRVSAGAVDGDDGVITYTQWLDDDGLLEADLTVTKLGANRFWVVASDTAHGHALDWLRRAGHGHDDITITDITADWAQLALQGPRSRVVLATLTDADLSTAAYPFRAAREIDVAGIGTLCTRITYVGELGYELYVPAARALEMYDALIAAGAAPVGLAALGSLRMEKAYRDFGHDIDNTDDPDSVGLGFALALDKPGGFVGRDSVLARRAAGPAHRRLVQVVLADPEPLLFHAEPLLRDGTVVGYVRAASYGWTLGAAVGLAFVSADQPVTADWLASGRWQVDAAGTRFDAATSLRPLYDPTSARVRV